MSTTDNVGTASAFSRLLGLEFLQVGGGEARVRLTLTDELRNLHGKLHGGALFSLIDTAMGQASHSLSNEIGRASGRERVQVSVAGGCVEQRRDTGERQRARE